MEKEKKRKKKKLKVKEVEKIKLITLKTKYIFKKKIVSNYTTYTILILIYLAAS